MRTLPAIRAIDPSWVIIKAACVWSAAAAPGALLNTGVPVSGVEQSHVVDHGDEVGRSANSEQEKKNRLG